jgi:hypothetical protein
MQLAKEGENGRFHLAKRCFWRPVTGDQHTIPARLNFCQMQTHRFTEQPTRSIALHRLAYAPTGDKGKAAHVKTIGMSDQHRQGMAATAALLPDTAEIGRMTQPMVGLQHPTQAKTA